MNFFEKFMQHKVKRDDLFSYVEKWHKNPEGKSLTDFLGMTLEQYHLFLMEPKKVESLSRAYERLGRKLHPNDSDAL